MWEYPVIKLLLPSFLPYNCIIWESYIIRIFPKWYMKSKCILNFYWVKTLLVTSYRNPVQTGFWSQKEKLIDSQKQRTGWRWQEGAGGLQDDRIGTRKLPGLFLLCPIFLSLHLPSFSTEDCFVPSPAEMREFFSCNCHFN